MTCVVCEKKTDRLCSGCMKVLYCSKECRLKDYDSHIVECKWTYILGEQEISALKGWASDVQGYVQKYVNRKKYVEYNSSILSHFGTLKNIEDKQLLKVAEKLKEGEIIAQVGNALFTAYFVINQYGKVRRLKMVDNDVSQCDSADFVSSFYPN